MQSIPICRIGEINNNQLYIMREDLIPYSFGGNKARKGILFFDEIDKSNFDCVVTYGSTHSNHCRIIANMAAERGIKCYIIGPDEISDVTFNSKMMNLFGAEITTVPVEQVHDTIENELQRLRNEGHKPYFIPGGGHGNIGTEAYVQCYEEIKAQEKEQGIHFDYIFFASGTGTTHAGLVCGQLLNSDNREVVGISIARQNPRGRDVIIDSIHDYLSKVDAAVPEEEIQKKTVFVDDYIGPGYGRDSGAIVATIKEIMVQYGIPLDSTYTGKAFYGMKQYIQENQIENKVVLFIHTGGTPLYFDDINNF